MKNTFKKRMTCLLFFVFILPMMAVMTPGKVYAAQSTITAQDVTIEQDTTFNALQGVKAIDSTGVETTSKLVVTGSVDAHTPGIYSIKYSLTDSTGDNTEKTRKVTVVAKPLIGKVKVIVTGNPEYESEKSLIGGVVFSITEETNGKEVARVTSTNQVALIINLPYGKYKIQPVQFPNGVGKQATAYTNDLIVDKPNVEYVFPVRHLISAIYLDSYVGDKAHRLGGVVYEIKDLKGKLLTTLMSNSDGNISVELPDGKYTVTVVKIPKGYKLSPKSQKTITVVGEGKRDNVYDFIFEKSTTSSGNELPKTNGQVDTPTSYKTGVGFIVLGGVALLGVIVLVKKKVTK